jgi:phage FluMu protein Com
MQIRCVNCHKPFAISKDEIYIALDTLNENGLSHYNAHCPHCRRANRVSREELQRSAPDWQPNRTSEETSSP